MLVTAEAMLRRRVNHGEALMFRWLTEAERHSAILDTIDLIEDRAYRVGNAVDAHALVREIREKLLHECFDPVHDRARS